MELEDFLFLTKRELFYEIMMSGMTPKNIRASMKDTSDRYFHYKMVQRNDETTINDPLFNQEETP